jgi:2-polyprenyl-3-methyl-5-hydroxy-6-metoxy-1,4-benzoquinol methylase
MAITASHQFPKSRRQFHWVSSSDARNLALLHQLSEKMAHFYSMPATREAYQQMIALDTSAQPFTEHALTQAVLAVQGQTVLELGCGNGRLYRQLIDAGMVAAYTGVEVSEDVIAANKERYSLANWLCSSGYDTTLPPHTHDCVFAHYVLEHCAFPEKFLLNALRLVKPGGRVILTFPDMVEASLFGSQALGLDARSASNHLKHGRLLHALIRLWDTRVRLPRALKRAAQHIGPFPVNLCPLCLEPGISMTPDVDAIYVASRSEVENWAIRQGCGVRYPAGIEGILRVNVLVELIAPAGQ